VQCATEFNVGALNKQSRWQHKKALAIEKTRMRVIASNRASYRENSHESCTFSLSFKRYSYACKVSANYQNNCLICNATL